MNGLQVAVDRNERYAELTSAGYLERRPPFDAFWGCHARHGGDRSSTTGSYVPEQ